MKRTPRGLQQVKKKLDRKYEQLKVDIAPVARSSEKWKIIEESISSTHASTHQNFTMEVMDLFRV